MRRPLITILTIAAAGLMAAERDESAAQLAARSVEALLAGDVEPAEQLASQALALDPSHPGALEVAGHARLARGETDAARSLFERIEAGATPPAPAARGAYHAGVALVERARAEAADWSSATFPDGARSVIETLELAADGFASSLRIDGHTPDAARNLELSRYWIRRLRDTVRERERQQREMRRIAESLGDLSSRQSEERDQTREEGDEHPTDDQRGDQQQLSGETARAGERLDDLIDDVSRGDDQASGAGESLEPPDRPTLREALDLARRLVQRGEEKQDAAGERLEDLDRPGAADAQDEAAMLLREAASLLASSSGEGEPSEQDGPGDGGDDTERRADDGSGGAAAAERASEVLDREGEVRRRLEEARRALRRPAEPVERDW